MKKVYAGIVLGAAVFVGSISLSNTGADFFASQETTASITTGTLKIDRETVPDPMFYTFQLDASDDQADGLWQPGTESAPKTFGIKNVGTLDASIYKMAIIQKTTTSEGDNAAAVASINKNLEFVIKDRTKKEVFRGTYGELSKGITLEKPRLLTQKVPKEAYEITAHLNEEAGNELQGMATEFDFVVYAKQGPGESK